MRILENDYMFDGQGPCAGDRGMHLGFRVGAQGWG